MRLCRSLAAMALIALCAASTPAAACDQDTIDSIADDGSIIVMTSGASFRVSPLDQTDAMFWLAEDDVLICKGETEIINKNEKRERIRVSRIR
jgi:ABC-type amino acid transport substrate-binding protein